VDANGAPVAGQSVQFSAAGGGAVLTPNVTTNSSGKAGTTFKIFGSLGDVTVTATATGVGSVSFKVSGRLPTLGEVAGGTLAGTTPQQIDDLS